MMQISNPRVAAVKLDDVLDRSLMRKLEETGFIDRMDHLYPPK